MKVDVTDWTIKVTPTNPRWEGFGKLTPVCKCGAHMAHRFDDQPWRCVRGHFTTGPRAPLDNVR